MQLLVLLLVRHRWPISSWHYLQDSWLQWIQKKIVIIYYYYHYYYYFYSYSYHHHHHHCYHYYYHYYYYFPCIPAPTASATSHALELSRTAFCGHAYAEVPSLELSTKPMRTPCCVLLLALEEADGAMSK